MELKGEYRVPAPREHVWAMLNDPAVLRECIPGCESLEGSPAEGFAARVTTKVGPVKATFNGQVTLSNVNPPESYTISGEGKGGVAGFAKGGADVHLAPDGDAHDPHLHGQRAGRRKARAARLAPDQFNRQEACGSVLFVACRESRRRGSPGITSAASIGAAGVDAPPPGTIEEVVQNVEHAAHEMEEEVEAKAAMGFLGGPIVWALLVILALLLVYGFAM